MKATVIFFVVLIVVVSCMPNDKIKKLKEDQARKKACMNDCTTVSYDPICAGKPGDKHNLSFGSECVMNNYNCEHKETLSRISKGECPGSDGIRLS